jgi:glycogen debranching enzyme
VTGDDGLAAGGRELAEALAARWDPDLTTWVDDGPTAGGSGRARSLEALLGALVDPDASHVDAALAELVDPAAHGARYGPTGLHRAEAAYSPTTYWRGPAWPQLAYLLWVAAARRGATAVASTLADSLVAGAAASGLAEYWHPDTGAPGGAVPQSWTALAWVVAEARLSLRGRPRGGR